MTVRTPAPTRPATGDDVDQGRAFRDLLGTFATGVVVVSSVLDDRRDALVVNSFTSVSLEPAMVAFCAGHTSSTWPRIRAAGRFAVSILAAHQEDFARACASSRVDRFDDDRTRPHWGVLADGLPVVSEALGWLTCDIANVVPAGDHDIVVGRVREMSEASPDDALVFHRGLFGRLGR